MPGGTASWDGRSLAIVVAAAGAALAALYASAATGLALALAALLVAAASLVATQALSRHPCERGAQPPRLPVDDSVRKQRLTKMTQYLIRMRKMRLKPRKLVERVHKKVDLREKRREIKAEKAALIDKAIQKELLTRLKAGTYGDIYNFPMKEYEDALDEEERELEAEEEAEGEALALEGHERPASPEQPASRQVVEDLRLGPDGRGLSDAHGGGSGGEGGEEEEEAEVGAHIVSQIESAPSGCLPHSWV